MGDATDGLERFFGEYRATFARFDRDALTALFVFPLQVVSATDDGATVSALDETSWPVVLDGLFDAYRSLGVVDAEPLEFDVAEVTAQVLAARLKWELRRSDDSPVYDFTAIYTVAQIDGAFRITAIAHDELPKLDQALRSQPS